MPKIMLAQSREAHSHDPGKASKEPAILKAEMALGMRLHSKRE